MSTSKPNARRLAVVTAAVACAFALSACATTVAKVDLDRYLGRWFQPKGYEQPFTAGLVGITAEYGLNADGTVSVRNRGFVGACGGPVSEIVGVAKVVDPVTNAKLEVRFPSVPITEVVPGQYWIVGLDPDYQWAVVTDSLKLTLFVLSREPALSPSASSAIDAVLDAQGFDRTRIKDVVPCP